MAIRNGISPRRRKNSIGRGRARSVIDLPSPADEGSISQTTIYPTIDAMFAESIAKLPWFEQYSRETRRTIRFAFVTAVAETLRTVAFRLNSDQNWDVYDEFGKEITAYNKELLHGDDMRAAAILGLPS